MPSPNARYSPEVREQTAEFILSSGKSATSVAEEMGIDTNTVCKWLREYLQMRPLMPIIERRQASRATSQRRSAPVHDLVPDLVPKYMVTVGTRWDLLGLTAAPLYQRVPIVTNSHKHNQDSNSLGGTIKPQVRGGV